MQSQQHQSSIVMIMSLLDASRIIAYCILCCLPRERHKATCDLQVPSEQRLPLLLKGGLDPEKDLENIKLIFKVRLAVRPAVRPS